MTIVIEWGKYITEVIMIGNNILYCTKRISVICEVSFTKKIKCFTPRFNKTLKKINLE